MAHLYVATNEDDMWFWDKEFVTKSPYTRFCMEEVSDEMYSILVNMWNSEEYATTIVFMLYSLLDMKGIGSN